MALVIAGFVVAAVAADHLFARGHYTDVVLGFLGFS
jgi:hypothetical protein